MEDESLAFDPIEAASDGRIAAIGILRMLSDAGVEESEEIIESLEAKAETDPLADLNDVESEYRGIVWNSQDEDEKVKFRRLTRLSLMVHRVAAISVVTLRENPQPNSRRGREVHLAASLLKVDLSPWHVSYPGPETAEVLRGILNEAVQPPPES